MIKKTLLFVMAIILSTGISVAAKSRKTTAEVFLQKISKLTDIDKNGHIPHRISTSRDFPWQSGNGVKKVLVLPCEFPDETHSITRKTLEDFFISDKTFSVKGYYDEVSDGRLAFELGSVGLVDWMQLKKPYMEYVEELDYSYYDICDAVASDAMKMFTAKGHDLTEYDTDENGVPDIILFFFAGDSRRVGGYMPGAFCSTGSNGVVIMVSEDLSSRSNNTPSLIHELGHGMIPLEDLYDYSFRSDPYQDWDIMDGSAEGKCGMSAFSRWKAGWIDIKWIEQPGAYEVDNLNGEGPNKAYGIRIPGAKTEWILIENRHKTGVDNIFAGINGEGLVTYLVDDKRKYEHLFNTLYDDFNTHGIIFLKLLRDGSTISADTSPNTLPYVKVERVAPNIGISNISKPGEKMTFTLSFDRPKLPVAGVPNKVFLGKIPKNTRKTFEIPFVNVGSGTLHVIMSTKDKWLTLDRTSFIGNEESVAATIDTAGLKKGKTAGTVLFLNKSSETNGFVVIEFEVAPIFGDLDGNDRVDEKDFEEMIKYLGLKGDDPGFKPEADFNSDGRIDLDDLFLLAKNYRQHAARFLAGGIQR